ncbi:STAS domain-containing protein [Turicimonas sp. TL08]
MKISQPQITNANAMEVLDEGLKALRQGDFIVDLSGVERIDSSAIAIALKWKQEAQKLGGDLKFIHASENLIKLSDLYNVSSLLMSSSKQ